MDTITVVVTESVTRELTLDLNGRHDWLLRYPRSDWQRLLEQDVNSTESTTEQALKGAEVDGAWREVEIITPAHRAVETVTGGH